MKKTDETKKLSLRRETLKELSVDDLRRVAGASIKCAFVGGSEGRGQ
jgi:hypothetical protein